MIEIIETDDFKEKIPKIGDRICYGLYEKKIMMYNYTALPEAAKRIGFDTFKRKYPAGTFKKEIKKLGKERKVHDDNKGWRVVALSSFGIKYIIQKISEWKKGLFN